MYHGLAAFNRKLREKYGTDLNMELRHQQGTSTVSKPASVPRPESGNLLDLDLDELETKFQNLGSANPFDDVMASSGNGRSTRSLSTNPFD